MANNPFTVLKTRYYLEHFEEMIDFVESHYGHVIDTEHETFINGFRQLSLDARCLYVRLANRKGSVFPLARLKYEEIASLPDSIDELKSCHFARGIDESDYREILESMTRPEVVELVKSHTNGSIAGSLKISSAKKSKITAFALEHVPFRESIPVTSDQRFVVQDRIKTLEFILFLFFGNNEANLTSFALRDLGVVKTGQLKTKFEARFSSAEEARASFFYSRLYPTIKEASGNELIALAEQHSDWPDIGETRLESVRHRSLHQLGLALERINETEKALSVYETSRQFPATERQARLLYSEGRKEDAEQLLNALIRDPSSDGELIFAEDFYERKFKKKKVGRLTELLRSAPVLQLDESLRDRPEQAAIHHYAREGIRAFHTENAIWQHLFGVFLWDLIFDPDKAALHNSFEMRPSDLKNGVFYRKRLEALQERLQQLNDPDTALSTFNKNWEEQCETPNGVTQWLPEYRELVRELILRAKPGSLATVLESMLKDYRTCRSGYPDLMLLDGDEVRFVEVKAQGDQLRRNQLLQLEKLQRTGFSVEVNRVEWIVHPEQDYVVVDIETTGGNAKWNRVTEIGAVKIRNGEVIDKWQTLINPERSIPWRIVDLTGITDEMVAEAPIFARVADEFEAFMGEAVFVAHNAKFDYSFLKEEFARLERGFYYPTLCTVVASRRYFPGLKSYGLSKLCTHFEIELESHHRALCDAQATAEILMRINEKRIQQIESAPSCED
ncbi:MAG: exonuclease domain-containing protein [Verrucomicrobiales bacterium]|nr:exonuclease domain-containing protein [Verrucomicrobiales bacterium]